jgi:hypothetical protein
MQCFNSSGNSFSSQFHSNLPFFRSLARIKKSLATMRIGVECRLRGFQRRNPDLNSKRATEGSLYRRDRKVRKSMPLLPVVVALIVVGVLLWLVNSFIPMASSIKSILNAVVVIAVVLWLLNPFGPLHSLSNMHIGK